MAQQPSKATQSVEVSNSANKPQTAADLFGKAQMLEKIGQTDPAIAHYRFCLAIDPSHQQALFHVGNLLITNNMAVASLPYFRVLNALRPDYVPARINHAIALKRLGRIEPAIEQLEHAVQHEPNSLPAWRQLADLYRTGKHFDKCRNAYQRWSEIEPEDPKPRFMLDALDSHISPDATTPERAPDDFVASYFDQYATSFDAHANSIMRYQVPAIFKRLVDHLGFAGLDDVNALDLGCGTGLCGEFLAPFAARLDGIDLSPAMIKAAKDKGYYTNLIEADLITGMQDLPKQSYDIVLAGDVFCYIGDLSDVFGAVRDRLSARGRFIFSVEAMTYNEVDKGAKHFTLRDSGRYAHHRDYIHDLAEEKGLHLDLSGQEALRLEFGKPVAGWVVVARLPD